MAGFTFRTGMTCCALSSYVRVLISLLSVLTALNLSLPDILWKLRRLISSVKAARF